MIYNGGPKGPEEATYTTQGFGQHIEVGTVNGWRAVWGGRMSVLG